MRSRLSLKTIEKITVRLFYSFFLLFVVAVHGQDFLSTCKSCHLPFNHHEKFFMGDIKTFDAHAHADTTCSSCHVNLHILAKKKERPNWVIFSRENINYFSEHLLYISAPPLVARIHDGDRIVHRYTLDGLKSFLRSPRPRYVGKQSSMFPIVASLRETLLSSWRTQLDAVPQFINQSHKIANGKKLFAQCINCHGQRDHENKAMHNIPLLRIGIPLLSYDYFRTRLRHGGKKTSTTYFMKQVNVNDDISLAIPVPVLSLPTSSHLYFSSTARRHDEAAPWLHHLNNWQLTSGTISREPLDVEIMPAFSDMKESDIEDLYSYIVNSDEDNVRETTPEKSEDFLIGLKLYQEIEKKVFKTSCVHCHSDNPATKHVMKQTFGVENEELSQLNPFPPLDKPSLYLSYWQRIFQTTSTCGPSILAQRLYRRHEEWNGSESEKADGMRGMPLTMPPVAKPIIDQVHVWTTLGCPSPYGSLCRPCTN